MAMTDEFGLGSCFQSKMIRSSSVNDLFDHFPHLIHFNWINTLILSLITKLGDSLPKGFIQRNDSMPNDILKTNQNGHLEALRADFFDDTLKINPRSFSPLGMNGHVSRGIDTEILVTPVLNIIKLQRIRNTPGFHIIPLYHQMRPVAKIKSRILRNGLGDKYLYTL